MIEITRQLSVTLSSRHDRDTITERDDKCEYTCCVPSCCQRFRDIRFALAFMCWSVFLQNVLTNGLVNSVITTLERRYELTSKESGAIASSYDIGNLIMLLPVTYLGANMRKPRLVSFGIVLVSCGSFLFYFAHLVSDYYHHEVSVVPLCYRNDNVSYSSLCNNHHGSKLNSFKYLFWFAHLIVGFGTTPLYTLGMVYLDENLLAPVAAFYMGIFYASCVFGPAMGFMLGSITLKFHVDTLQKQPPVAESNGGKWIGAWWIGFLAISFASLIPIIPLYGLPKQMPHAETLRSQKKNETYGKSEKSASKIDSLINVKNFALNVKLLLSNPTFMFINLAGVTEAVIATGFSTFGVKFIQEVFFQDAGSASRFMGTVLIPTGISAVLLSSIIIRYFQLTSKGILKMQLIMAVMSIPTFLGFYLDCGTDMPNLGVAGVTTPYSGIGSVTSINLTDACNVDCKCNPDGSLFDEVCGSNRLTYYSPCYAGCTTKSKTGYENCTCVNTNATELSKFQAQPKTCTNNCSNTKWFLVVCAINIFCLFFITVPTTSVTLRSVPEAQRSLAMGIQWLFVRFFGSIVGPVVFGQLFDYSCVMWTTRCGEEGDCGIYDTYNIRIILTVFGMTLKSATSAFLCMAWFMYRHDEDDSNLKKSSSLDENQQPPTEKGNMP